MIEQAMAKHLDQILKPEKLAIDAGVQFRTNILHLGFRTLTSAFFDQDGTFEEIRNFTFEEHIERAFNKDFLRKKITTTLWETLVLSTVIAGFFYIGDKDFIN